MSMLPCGNMHFPASDGPSKIALMQRSLKCHSKTIGPRTQRSSPSPMHVEPPVWLRNWRGHHEQGPPMDAPGALLSERSAGNNHILDIGFGKHDTAYYETEIQGQAEGQGTSDKTSSRLPSREHPPEREPARILRSMPGLPSQVEVEPRSPRMGSLRRGIQFLTSRPTADDGTSSMRLSTTVAGSGSTTLQQLRPEGATTGETWGRGMLPPDRGTTPLFLMENPQKSRLWELPEIQQLASRDDVYLVQGHSGAYGATNSRGRPPSRRRISG